MLVRLGFASQDKSVYHLLVDEAQDYSETALALLHAYLPNARVTLLGDPMQRTCPGMPVCRPENWGDCFGMPDAPVFHLTRCYRSSMPIGELCNALLPGGERLNPFGREGEKPLVAQYSFELLKQKLDEKGVTNIPHFGPLYRFAAVKEMGLDPEAAAASCPVCEEVSDRRFTHLPIYGLSDEQLKYMADAILESVKEMQEGR
jgi:hypothetical protein